MNIAASANDDGNQYTSTIIPSLDPDNGYGDWVAVSQRYRQVAYFFRRCSFDGEVYECPQTPTGLFELYWLEQDPEYSQAVTIGGQCETSGYTPPPVPGLPDFSEKSVYELDAYGSSVSMAITTKTYYNDMQCQEVCTSEGTKWRLEGAPSFADFQMLIAYDIRPGSTDGRTCGYNDSRMEPFVTHSEQHETVHANLLIQALEDNREDLGEEFDTSELCELRKNAIHNAAWGAVQAATQAPHSQTHAGEQRTVLYCPVQSALMEERWCGNSGNLPFVTGCQETW